MFEKGVKMFSDRNYQMIPIPEALEGAKFIGVNIDGAKSIQYCKVEWSIFSRLNQIGTKTVRELQEHIFTQFANFIIKY